MQQLPIERIIALGDCVHAYQVAREDRRLKAFAVLLAHVSDGGQEARIRPHIEILRRQFSRYRGCELTEQLAVLDIGVQVLRGIGIKRRRQDAAVAQRARPELHAPVHPGHDFVIAQARDGGVDQLFVCQQVSEPQLAILQHLLHLLGTITRTEAQVAQWQALPLPTHSVPGFEHRAQRSASIAAGGLHENTGKLL